MGIRNPKGCRVRAGRILQQCLSLAAHSGVQAMIQARNDERTDDRAADMQEINAFWTKIMREEAGGRYKSPSGETLPLPYWYDTAFLDGYSMPSPSDHRCAIDGRLKELEDMFRLP